MRRLHIPTLRLGLLPLDAAQLHHIRDVLRLSDGDVVEVFDNAGQVAAGTLRGDGVAVTELISANRRNLSLTIAAAVPKGDRADWMVEKLSELGVECFVPLAAERSVVLPQGKSKHQRWQRIAIESAKQSRRLGVMRIGELTLPLHPTLQAAVIAYLSTAPGALPIQSLIQAHNNQSMLFYIGPEGGWSERECAAFGAAGLTAIGLTDTILRIETAAVAAAAIAMTTMRPVTTQTGNV